MTVVSKYRSLGHYLWGNDCEGWNLVDESAFSVKLEKMPPQTSEQKHFHEHAQQFFYILKGEAVFEILGERLKVKPAQGIHVRAGAEHRIVNEGSEDLEFILASVPSTIKDRINTE